MPNKLSGQFLKAVAAEDNGDGILVLLSLIIPGMDEVLLFVNNDIDVRSKGIDYVATGFNFVEPAVGTGRRAVARLQIDNIDLLIPNTIASMGNTPPKAIIQIVSSEDPNAVERSYNNFVLQSVSWSNLSVDGSLNFPDDQDEPVVSFRYTPSTAPALFVR